MGPSAARLPAPYACRQGGKDHLCTLHVVLDSLGGREDNLAGLKRGLERGTRRGQAAGALRPPPAGPAVGGPEQSMHS